MTCVTVIPMSQGCGMGMTGMTRGCICEGMKSWSKKRLRKEANDFMPWLTIE